MTFLSVIAAIALAIGSIQVVLTQSQEQSNGEMTEQVDVLE